MPFTRSSKQPGPTSPHDRPERTGPGLSEFHRARVETAVHSVPIPALADDPKYDQASRVDRVLRTALQRVKDELDLLALEAEHQRLGFRDPKSERVQLELRRAQTLRARLAETAPAEAPQVPGDVPAEVQVALDMLAGSKLVKKDRAKRIAELKEQAEVLEAGCRAQGSVLEEIRQGLSYQVCGSLREAHNDLLRQQLHAAQSLAAATDAERAMRAAILAAGYDVLAHVIVVPAVKTPLILGSEQDLGSEVSTWAQILKNNGVV
jgi:hypothetical protein